MYENNLQYHSIENFRGFKKKFKDKILVNHLEKRKEDFSWKKWISFIKNKNKVLMKNEKKNKKKHSIQTNLVHVIDFVQLLVYIFQFHHCPYERMDFEHNNFYKQWHCFVDHV